MLYTVDHLGVDLAPKVNLQRAVHTPHIPVGGDLTVVEGYVRRDDVAVRVVIDKVECLGKSDSENGFVREDRFQAVCCSA